MGTSSGTVSVQEELPPLNGDLVQVAGTYVLTLEPDAETDDFSRYAERAKERKYDYLEWRTGHNPQRTIPAEYVAFLMGIE